MAEFNILSPHEVASNAGSQTLYVRNVSDKIVSHSDVDGGRLTLGPSWSHESLAILPEKVARSGEFQRLVRAGTVIVSNDPSIERDLSIRTEEIEQREQDAINSRLAPIDTPAADRDIVAKNFDRNGVARDFEAPSVDVEKGVPTAHFDPAQGRTVFTTDTVSN